MLQLWKEVDKMASTKDYVDYVCEHIAAYGIISNKKMFGEYMIYINAKPIILICDNTPYIKMKDEIKEYMGESSTDFPYNGAKEHYILDIEDRDITSKVLPILEQITPLPKPKKK